MRSWTRRSMLKGAIRNGSTRTMMFGVAYIISNLSQYISTRTLSGVGMGQRPPIYLVAGNTIQLGIEGLGVQLQRVVADCVDSHQGATNRLAGEEN